jgi:hypothetical protein
MTKSTVAEESTTYCSVDDVRALAPSRKLGEGNNPTQANVQSYIEGVEAEINGVLTLKGYSVPVLKAQAPLAFALLRRVTSQGAAAQLEASAGNNPAAAERTEKVYVAALKQLSTADEILDAAQNVERSKPRGPGVTNVSPAPGNAPFFSRDETTLQF